MGKRESSTLESSELKQLLRIAGEAAEVSSASQFQSWVQSSISKLLPHEALVAGTARREGERVKVEKLLSSGFPLSFIEAVRAARGSFACPTLETWFGDGRPQLFDPEADKRVLASDEFHAHQLKNVAAHGVLSPSGEEATYFSFSRIPEPLTKRHALVLELLAPHLHRAYIRALRATPNPGTAPVERAFLPKLTRSELAVLRELYLDGGTKMIALSLGRSANTVKHQVRSLLKKLGARDRQEAVSVAIRLGLLPDRRLPRPPEHVQPLHDHTSVA